MDENLLCIWMKYWIRMHQVINKARSCLAVLTSRKEHEIIDRARNHLATTDQQKRAKAFLKVCIEAHHKFKQRI